MPDRRIPILRSRHFDDGYSSLSNWVSKNLPTARQLSLVELLPYHRRNIVAGWELVVVFNGEQRRLHLLVDSDFPRTIPLVALRDRPPHLTWPHISEDGTLCLLPPTTEIDYRSPEVVVQHVLALAAELIEELLAGLRDKDFEDEFLSYWGQGCAAFSIYSLLKATPPSRDVAIWNGQIFSIIGEDSQQVQRWLANYSTDRKRAWDIETAAFEWIETPFHPNAFPKSADDVCRIMGEEKFSNLIAAHPERSTIVFGMNSANGPCYAGVRITPKPKSSHVRRSTHEHLTRGFRPNKIPSALFLQRYRSASNVNRLLIERVDAEWVHGRGVNSLVRDLSQKRVTIVGCGALGSGVAGQLAQAGVGNFCFIDPQILSWENVGRHYLGAQDVGTPKSLALASQLQRSYPHLDSVVSFRGKWNEMPSEATAALSRSDVVVSAIGDWSVEGAINEWHLNQNRIPRVVYGWTEPFACAGHAVVIGQTGGCLQCGFNETGMPLFRATSWPSETLRRAPACGDFFQPYGPIDLSHSITLVAETVIDCLLNKVNNSIHKFWIGRRSLLEVSGGEWSPEWESNQQFRAEGGYFAEAPWLPISACAECGAK